MRLRGFAIQNFKGIREASVRFSENDQARVHTLVGLNESGKTTLLEALHSFSPDAETQRVVKNATSIERQREQWVPRNKISSFTGEVSVIGYVAATKEDWDRICESFAESTDLLCDATDLPQEFEVRLAHSYSNGDFRRSYAEIPDLKLRVKSRRAKNFRDSYEEECDSFVKLVRETLPSIAYYPTFVFDFPDRIYLTERDRSPRNEFYRRLLQDILDYDGSGYTIEESILRRLRKSELKGVWSSWFSKFAGTTEEDKVKQVIARAERAVTELVFSRWTEVFGEKVGAKEIVLDLQYEKGEPIVHADGSKSEPTEHDAYVRFRIKDGTSVYAVDDRSLGFRWFFAFLLFTQFRVRRESRRSTIFLFDEPASNLHAAAQKKLLESFPAIAVSPHRLIYSTHSHYMVDPRWLEQAYIVFDRSVAPGLKVIDEGVRADAQVDVQVVSYRKFVVDYPAKTSYFQPILDTLEVQPSYFDYRIGGLVVEGKSDFYYLKFSASVLAEEIGPLFPAVGAGTMGALVALHRGWGLPVRVMFDSDKGGRDGQRNLVSEFSLSESEMTHLDKLCPGMSRIEDVLSPADQRALGGSGEGSQKQVVLRRVQESLASGLHPELTEDTKSRMRQLLRALKEFLPSERRGTGVIPGQ